MFERESFLSLVVLELYPDFNLLLELISSFWIAFYSPSNDETLPSNDETVPPSNEMLPPVNETVPLSCETLPLNDEMFPLNNETIPLNLLFLSSIYRK